MIVVEVSLLLFLLGSVPPGKLLFVVKDVFWGQFFLLLVLLDWPPDDLGERLASEVHHLGGELLTSLTLNVLV